MTRRTRGNHHSRRAISILAFVVLLVVLVMSWPRAADAAGIARAYSPDVTSAALADDLVVNSYGVAGLGLFRMTLDDGSSSAAVCIQADVSHSAAASYHPAAPAYDSGALDYLAWRYLRAGSVSDVQAAGLNPAAWGLTGPRRNVGGAVWEGGTLTAAVRGVGPRDDIESAAISLLGESVRRRGPWTLAAPDAAAGSMVRVSAVGPGRGVEYIATGSQRVALAGPPSRLDVGIALPPAATTTTTTTSTSTTTTSTSTTTTSLPATSTTGRPSTSTTVARTTTLPGPTSSTTVAPANPATGNSGRPVVRVGAFLFALGSIATYVASGTRRNAVREVDLDGHDI